MVSTKYTRVYLMGGKSLVGEPGDGGRGRWVGDWFSFLRQQRVPSRSYPTLPAASGESFVRKALSAELNWSREKQRKPYRCTGEISEIFKRISRPTVNSPKLRKRVKWRKQSRHGKKVKVLNLRSFAHLQVLMIFPTNTQIVVISVTSR